MWKPVIGYGGWYAVSSTGKIKRVKGGNRNTVAGRILKQTHHSRGYRTVALSRDGKVARKYVHKLVAEAFLGACPKGGEVNHRDGNKANNHRRNLEYTTRGGNVRHARDELGAKFGTRGEKHPKAKLTEAKVHEIRHRYAAGELQRVLATEFGVHNTQISGIVRRVTWKHI